MRKFKLNEKGFLDSSYNFEEIKKQYQDEIARAKSKLNDYQEGTDYTVSYEGQKKIYTIISPQLRKVYWGDNLLDGFEYSIEETDKEVRTKMKMVGSFNSYQSDNFQRSIGESSGSQVSSVNHEEKVDEVKDKISFLEKELQQKEEVIKNLTNYPEKQENVRSEIEEIKSSIRELSNQPSEKNYYVEKDIEDNHKKGDGKGSNSFAYWGLGSLFLVSLVGIVATIKLSN